MDGNLDREDYYWMTGDNAVRVAGQSEIEMVQTRFHAESTAPGGIGPVHAGEFHIQYEQRQVCVVAFLAMGDVHLCQIHMVKAAGGIASDAELEANFYRHEGGSPNTGRKRVPVADIQSMSPFANAFPGDLYPASCFPINETSSHRI